MSGSLMRLAPPLAVLGLLAAPPAFAHGDEPHCDDGKRAPAARICGQFEAATKLAPNDPHAQKVVAVWRRIAPPVEALTGRQTALSVLAPDALMANGQPFPPSAYICPGAPPTVYVPHSLVERVYGEGAAYTEDFLGFVLGHELGHRINDFTPDGCQLGAFERPGRGVQEEQLADFRGAFFAAIGGFSTRGLARDRTVSAFLAEEFKVREHVQQERHGALLSALEHFDAYEGLYSTGVALTFAGEHAPALRLLAWADELVEGRGVPLPELKVVRALALMMSAAEHAPWQEAVEGLTVGLSHLRCQAIFPSHTALHEEPAVGRLRGPGEDRDRARRALELARRLLERASELGADRLITESGRACLAFYLGEHGEARRWQARAARRVSARSPASVRAAVAANEALLAFGSFVSEHPPPPPAEAAAATAWATRLVAGRDAYRPHPELHGAVELLASYPTPVRQRRAAAALLTCGGGPPKVSLPEVTFTPAGVGQCPASWAVAWSVPSPATVERSGTGMGITACERPDGVRAVHVKLAGALDPPLPATDASVITHDALPAGLRTLDAWACGCDAVQLQGTTDTGERTFMAACPDLAVPLGVLFVGADDGVRRMVVVDSK